MKQQDVFNKIGAILNELTEQYDYLKKDPSQLNELELELFVANAHFLMDHADILRKINAQTTAEKPALPQPETFKEKIEHVVQLPVPDFGNEVDTVVDSEPVSEKVNQPEAVVYLPEVQEPAAEPEIIEPEPVIELEDEAPEPLTPVIETPVTAKQAEVHEQKFFEPVVQQLRPVVSNELKDTPKPIEYTEDEQPTRPDDHTTIDADGTIRHELVMDDTDDNWEDEEQTIEEPERFADEAVIEAEADQPEPETPAYVPEEPANPVTVELEPAKPVTVELAPAKPVQAEVPPVVITQTVVAADDNKDEQVFTINQRISVQMADKSTSVASPISDLKAAITLNDKLLYVHDLFNGYSLAYSEAIDILNRFNNFAEAERFLTANYVTKNNWQNKPATADKFYALLQRRYA